MDYIKTIEQGPFLKKFVTSNSHHTLYSVESGRRPGGQLSSSIRRNNPDGETVELANVTYIDWGTTRVMFGPHDVDLDEFLQRRSTTSNSRIFVGPDGQTYKWRIKGKHLELYHRSSRTLLVRSQARSNLLTGKTLPTTLYLFRKIFDPQTLDAVIVTFEIMEHLLRDRNKYGHVMTS